MDTQVTNKKIILFDGVCNLCNTTVVFVIKRDAKDMFRFVALQSEKGTALVNEYGIDTTKLDSVLLLDKSTYYYKSSAILQISKHLSKGWPMLQIGYILPKFLRDLLYDFIAKNRYKWFGKKEACMIPTPELKAKFL